MTFIRRLRGKRKHENVITFCDRCGEVCDNRCRSNAIFDHARSSSSLLPRI